MERNDAQINAVVHINAVAEPVPGERHAHITDYRVEPNEHIDEAGAINMAGMEGADIFFTVHNHLPDFELEFPDDPVDCIWIGEGRDCPAGPGDAGGEIRATDRTGDRMSLEVHNANATAGDFTYMLRLRRPGAEGAYVVLDPPIVNTGGGGGNARPPSDRRR